MTRAFDLSLFNFVFIIKYDMGKILYITLEGVVTEEEGAGNQTNSRFGGGHRSSVWNLRGDVAVLIPHIRVHTCIGVCLE